MSPVTLRRCHTLPCFCLSATAGARIILALYKSVKPLLRFLMGGLGGILCQVHSYVQCSRTDLEPKQIAGRLLPSSFQAFCKEYVEQFLAQMKK